MNMIVKEARESDISLLGDELLVEILCRLGTAKYATQCKSVCKRWCSVINTDPYLLRRWGQLNPKKESVTFITQYRGGVIKHTKRTTLTNLNFLPCFRRENPVRILGSYKDLLLCCPNSNDHSCYYICNPFTKQWTALPPPPSPPLARRHPTEKVLTRVEFIVDEGGDSGLKFTVVRICRYPLWVSGVKKVQVCIFSSDGGWREMEDGGEWKEKFQEHKGRLIWLMRKKLSGEDFRLYSWDLHSNYARLPRIPGYLTNAKNSIISMSTVGGHLRMAQMYDDRKKLIFRQWRFDDSQKQAWHTLQELDFTKLLAEDSRFKDGFRIKTLGMTFHPHDGDILYMVVQIVSNEWSSYIFKCNLKRGRLEWMKQLSVILVLVSGVEIFPIVKHSWPTPVPRLQPQLEVRASKTPSKITSFLMSRFVPCFGKSNLDSEILSDIYQEY